MFQEDGDFHNDTDHSKHIESRQLSSVFCDIRRRGLTDDLHEHDTLNNAVDMVLIDFHRLLFPLYAFYAKTIHE